MGRPNKPWYRPDIGWWVANIGRKQCRLAKGEDNKAEAERAFHELMALRPQRPDARDCRVCDLAEAFLEFARQEEYSEDTLRNYDFYLMNFCEARGYCKARDIIPHDVTQWVAAKKKRKKWNATSKYNGKRIVFRLFSWATEQGLLTVNPLNGFKREKPRITRRCLAEAAVIRSIIASHDSLAGFAVASPTVSSSMYAFRFVLSLRYTSFFVIFRSSSKRFWVHSPGNDEPETVVGRNEPARPK